MTVFVCDGMRLYVGVAVPVSVGVNVEVNVSVNTTATGRSFPTVLKTKKSIASPNSRSASNQPDSVTILGEYSRERLI